ncbi:hypothetical protein ACH5RR_014780 [Cinchona calisaya]|uniref:Uncharacterized protein n=1 Tax=Cinchona calisaya TaxID=153742 RepID=A0ABD2ZR97_9GENT
MGEEANLSMASTKVVIDDATAGIKNEAQNDQESDSAEPRLAHSVLVRIHLVFFTIILVPCSQALLWKTLNKPTFYIRLSTMSAFDSFSPTMVACMLQLDSPLPFLHSKVHFSLFIRTVDIISSPASISSFKHSTNHFQSSFIMVSFCHPSNHSRLKTLWTVVFHRRTFPFRRGESHKPDVRDSQHGGCLDRSSDGMERERCLRI